MLSKEQEESRERTADILRMALPLPGNDFVSRHEFISAMATVDSKIVNVELKVRNWILGGILTMIVLLGGGYVSLVSKIDRLTEAMPIVNEVLEGRRRWMMRQDQRDGQQDRALKSVVPDYEPPPYVEPPQ